MWNRAMVIRKIGHQRRTVGMTDPARPAHSVNVPWNTGVQPQVGIEVADFIVLTIRVAAITQESVGFH